MADIEFVKGEGGEIYDIIFTDDLTSYTAGTLTIKSTDLATAVKTITLTVPNSTTARWEMTTTDTDVPAGNYMGQIQLTGTDLVKKTFLKSVLVHDSLT